MQDPKQQQWLLQPGGVASRLRSLQGKTPGVEFAEKAGLRPSKVSKLRLGQQLPTEDDIKVWVAAAGGSKADETELLALLEDADQHHSSFERKLKRGQAKHQGHYNELVEQADLIRMFERSFVPRLLQTFDYAKLVMAGSMDLHKTEDDVTASAAERLKCQDALTDGRHRFEFILEETVLTKELGSAAVMYDQADRILRAMDLSNVRLGILPAWGRIRNPARNSFEMYGKIGIVELLHDELSLSTEVWSKYDQYMTDAWQDAVEGDEARLIIRRAMDHYAKAKKTRKPKGAR